MTDTITVGSSDAAAILGLSPWSTPGETWGRMAGLVPRYGGGSASTDRGNMLENALAEHWEELHGGEMTRGPTLDDPPIFGPEPWMHARPDSTVLLHDERWNVEIKTAYDWDGWGDPETGGRPVIYYQIQVAWQMMVCDSDHASLIAYRPMDDSVRIYYIERNMAEERMIVERIRQWMTAHVWGVPVAPPSTPPLMLHPSAKGDLAEPTEAIMSVARDLAGVTGQIAGLAGVKAALQDQLKAAIGDDRGIKGVATWGDTKGRTTIDNRKLKSEFPDAYQACRKTGQPGRTFRFNFKG